MAKNDRPEEELADEIAQTVTAILTVAAVTLTVLEHYAPAVWCALGALGMLAVISDKKDPHP